MATLSRTAPLTPLDGLRALLAEYSEGDANFQVRVTQTMQALKRQALPVLGAALRQPTSSKSLKRFIIGLVARFDWPEWTPHLKRALLAEGDLGVFDEGCAALGSLATRESLEALEEIQKARADQDRQVILGRELSLYQSPQGFGHYLGRLMEGSTNPRLAAQGARFLAVMVEDSQLPALSEAFRDGDELSQRLTLRVLAELGGGQARDWLTSLLDQVREEILDNLALKEVLHRAHTLPRASIRDEFLRMVQIRFQGGLGATLTGVMNRIEQGEAEASDVMEPLRQVARGHLEGFLTEGLQLLLESKVARFSAYLSESTDASEARETLLAQRADQVAELLAWRVDRGLSTVGEVLPSMGQAFSAKVGGDALIYAFLRHLPATETAHLEAILAEPDLRRRQQCLDALGSREDDALTEFFLRATQDPIVEVGQVAMHHLGKLPGSFPALMALFESDQPDQVRRAVRAFGENQTHLASEPLVDFVRRDHPREDLLVEAVEALAHLRYPAAAPALLELLHDGKPLTLQMALSKALGMIGTPQASLGLLEKAAALKPPQVLIHCLEGTLSAFTGFERPLPAEAMPALVQLVERCCDEREGEGQRLRAMLAMQGLYVFDRNVYEKLKDRFGDFLFEMRTKESWDRENNDAVAGVIKELGRRSESLGKIAQKEVAIRAKLVSIPPKGPKRVDDLLALREALADPDLILRPEFGREIADVVLKELKHQGEWKEHAHLCEIGGLTGQEDLVEPIRDVYLRASGLGLKSAAKLSLLRLGLPEAELNRRPPIRSILVIEPSAFFRKRLVASLAGQGAWELEEAGGRAEAMQVLMRRSVDLLLTEVQDSEGPLGSWLQEQWGEGRFRFALLATSHRDLEDLGQLPWVTGTLFKPFPNEQLLHALNA